MTWRDFVLTVMVSATVSLLVSLGLSYLAFVVRRRDDR